MVADVFWFSLSSFKINRFPNHFNTRKCGEVFNGFDKIQVAEIHQKTNGIAACATAKTMKELLVAVD